MLVLHFASESEISCFILYRLIAAVSLHFCSQYRFISAFSSDESTVARNRSSTSAWWRCYISFNACSMRIISRSWPCLWLNTICILTFVQPTRALHESDAGVIDWHKPLIGLPNSLASGTLPTFHRVRNDKTKTTNSVILVGTKSNVVSGLDTITGELSE